MPSSPPVGESTLTFRWIIVEARRSKDIARVPLRQSHLDRKGDPTLADICEAKRIRCCSGGERRLGLKGEKS
jgi:hypothetical protein